MLAGTRLSRKKWFPAILILLTLLSAGLIAGMLVGSFGYLAKTIPYQMALELARTHPDAVQELGLPIEPGWVITGQVNEKTTPATAELMFSVKGDRQGGAMRVEATRPEGEAWQITYADLGIGEAKNNGGRILLLVGDSLRPAAENASP